MSFLGPAGWCSVNEAETSALRMDLHQAARMSPTHITVEGGTFVLSIGHQAIQSRLGGHCGEGSQFSFEAQCVLAR